MSKRSNFNALEVGDKVRVLLAGTKNKTGDTVYVITRKGPRFQIFMREDHPTIKYAEQEFDASLVKLEPDNAKTARAMNASGAFKPFTVIPGR